MAGLTPILGFGCTVLCVYESYSDGATIVEHLSYQSQYFGPTSDWVRLASYEITDFHWPPLRDFLSPTLDARSEDHTD